MSIVTLRDGTRLIVTDPQIVQQQLRFRSPLTVGGPEPITVPLDQLDRIDIRSAGYRLVDLVSLPYGVTSGGAVFGLSAPPRVEGGALYLHAPLTLSFKLPESSLRVAAIAELADDDADPADLRRWADFDLSLASGQSQKRVRINAENPSHRLSLPVEGRELIVELDPGVNGPILDRLRLRDAAVLVRFEIDAKWTSSDASP
jgi:hypothetical protein